MTSKWFTSLISGAALLGVTLTSALPALAEQAPDKNGPGVARISIIEGSAVVQRGESHTQTAAVRNAPLLPGDYVSTGNTSRAELQFDGYTAIRLGGNVQARITNNDPNNRQMQLADGTVEIGMVHDGRTIQVDTPSVTVRAQQTGDYRVTIARDGSSWVTVRRGRLDVVTPQRTYVLEQGRTLVARGSASRPSIAYTSAVGFDSFDDFNAKRDQTMIAALNASPNLNPSIAGYDNLGAYGQWRDVAGYGQAWVPEQSANWAPYRDGSWVWEGGYGWTWVGAEPWGWAPYHYGRWFYANGYGWAWYPPAYAYTPAWSPALVGFFGFGAGFGGAGWGVSVGFGGGGYGYGCNGNGYGGYGYGGGYGYAGGCGYPYVGWVPLAPYETYYPWYPGWSWLGFGWGVPSYGCCGGFFGRTRIVNVTNIYNIYRNFRHGGGSGTLIGHWRQGTISGHTIAVNSRNLGTRVGTIHGALPVAPNRENLRFSNRALRAPVTFSRAFNTPRFATDRSLAARNSFASQQRAVTQAIHGTATARHENAPVTRNEATARGNAPVRANAPVARENAPATRENAPVARENAPVTRENGIVRHESAPSDSWQRFNQARGTELSGRMPEASARGSESSLRASGSGARASESSVRASSANTAVRAERAPSDSWGRFSQQRGSVSAATSGERGSYSRGESYGSASRGESYGNSSRSESYGNASRSESYGNSYSHGSYQRDPYGSYSRESAPSYSRESYPSYARGSYPAQSRESYPSYSRGSYPSYSRPSYQSAPSYSRGSYGSYPSYSRGSSPSYSRGPAQSAPHPSGGGGSGRGGRPPQH